MTGIRRISRYPWQSDLRVKVVRTSDDLRSRGRGRAEADQVAAAGIGVCARRFALAFRFPWL